MKRPIRILLQTTIPSAEDDWHIGRFSMLRDHLASLKSETGETLCEVATRDIERGEAGNDAVLSRLDETDFDESKEPHALEDIKAYVRNLALWLAPVTA